LIGTVEDSEQDSISYLVFYTVSRAKARSDQAEGDIYEVEYYLMKDEDKSRLMRRLWPNPNEEDEPGGILSVIAEDIDVFQVRYFDGEEWSEEWPEEMQEQGVQGGGGQGGGGQGGQGGGDQGDQGGGGQGAQGGRGG